VSAPKYQGLDWRVDVVAATNDVGGGRGAVPTTLLKLRVQVPGPPLATLSRATDSEKWTGMNHAHLSMLTQ
jgi:hypothetical protein